jgi:hypothetical protein
VFSVGLYVNDQNKIINIFLISLIFATDINNLVLLLFCKKGRKAQSLLRENLIFEDKAEERNV